MHNENRRFSLEEKDWCLVYGILIGLGYIAAEKHFFFVKNKWTGKCCIAYVECIK